MKLYTLDNQFIKETNERPSDFTGIIEHGDGTKEWFVDDKRHRLDGPAKEYSDGSKSWWIEGNRHRLDGPACEHPDGTKYWFVDGSLHRFDGPACEWTDGTKEWWVDGKQITEEQHNLLHCIMKLKGLL